MSEVVNELSVGAVVVAVVPTGLRAEFFSAASVDSLERSASALGGTLLWLESAQEFDAFSNSGRADQVQVLVTSWGFPYLDDELLDRLPNLKLVAHTGATVRPFVGPEFFGRGLHVTQAGDAMGRPVAEAALTFTLALLHQVHRFTHDLHAGESYERSQLNARVQHEIGGTTIGVVGASRTGRHYIELVKALGADVVVYDPFLSEDEAAQLSVRKMDLEQLMERSQIVAVHAPSLPETHHMINAELLARLQDGAGLVNTARSWLVDEQALIAEAGSGRIDAAVDVFDVEPFSADHPFRAMPNVLLTPHRAAGTVEGRLRGGGIVAKEIDRHVRGEVLRHAISLGDLERMA